MKIFKNKNIYAAAALLIVSAFAVRYFFFERVKKIEKYNILLLSTCSLRADRLGFNGKVPSSTPSIDKVANSSFIFENAYTDMSWSNVSGFLNKITSETVDQLGYKAIGKPWTKAELNWQLVTSTEAAPYYFRLPNAKDFARAEPSNYAEDLLALKKRLLDRSKWPFFIEAHNKTMHFPYGLGFGSEEVPAIRDKISEKSRAYLHEYVMNIRKYPERIPLGFFFLKKKEIIREVVHILKFNKAQAAELRKSRRSLSFVGILNNQNMLDRWSKSKYFKRDLEVIKEIYDKRLEIYDESINEMVNLYHDEELQKNTVIIFAGDHGEAFFEHGHMIHGNTVYDEMIRFPMFVKFPGQKRAVKIKKQFYQNSIYDIIMKIMSGDLNQNNFEEFMEKHGETPLIFSRNCANDIRSLRYKNEWKLIYDYKNDKKQLFNLVSDPSESRDVSDQNPDIMAFLLEKIDEVAKEQLSNKMIHTCTKENE